MSGGLQDTLLIAHSQQAWSVSRSSPQASVVLTGELAAPTAGRYLLLFTKAAVKEAADGVYEIYLSNEKLAAKDLTPQSPFFAGVADTYLLGGANSRQLSQDVSALVRNEKVKSGTPLVVTVLFRGNKSANGTESKEAGLFSVESTILVQTQ